MLTMFEDIEKLKTEWTDQYVVVTGNRPELARFDGYTGQVKTVNMSGRALVQFDAWNNIGWYDIDVEYLKIVPKPDPAMAGKRAETASSKAPAKAAAPAKEAGGKKAAPAAKGKRPSVPDILAACRANTPPAGKAPSVGSGDEGAAPAKEKAAPKAKAAKAAAPAKAGGGATMSQAALVKLPTPEKIAYCRQHDAG